MHFTLNYPNTHISIFALYQLLTTTLQEGPQVKLIARINFGRWCLLKTPANLLQQIYRKMLNERGSH